MLAFLWGWWWWGGRLIIFGFFLFRGLLLSLFLSRLFALLLGGLFLLFGGLLRVLRRSGRRRRRSGCSRRRGRRRRGELNRGAGLCRGWVWVFVCLRIVTATACDEAWVGRVRVGLLQVCTRAFASYSLALGSCFGWFAWGLARQTVLANKVLHWVRNSARVVTGLRG